MFQRATRDEMKELQWHSFVDTCTVTQCVSAPHCVKQWHSGCHSATLYDMATQLVSECHSGWHVRVPLLIGEAVTQRENETDLVSSRGWSYPSLCQGLSSGWWCRRGHSPSVSETWSPPVASPCHWRMGASWGQSVISRQRSLMHNSTGQHWGLHDANNNYGVTPLPYACNCSTYTAN